MKYVQINAYSGSWAENIVFAKHRALEAEGIESWVFWARNPHVQDDHMCKIATFPEVCLDVLQTRLDGKPGFHSHAITRRLLKRLDAIDPDVVHLHVLLGYYLNIEMLFEWLAAHRCQVVWTLHDCWSFTGRCLNFSEAGCEQWKTCCGAESPCPQPGTYPETLRHGRELWNFEQKKRLFTLLPADRMKLIAPSQWLADLVGESFMAKYPVEVVHNTVDARVFKPVASSFRERLGIGDRFLVLGVAGKWSPRKGLCDFEKLAEVLDARDYAIVVVGVDKTQARRLPESVIAMGSVGRVDELVEAYSAADVLFNPTRDDNFPTVNLEAQACGTSVITYDVGGCSETLSMEESSAVKGFEQGVSKIEDLRERKRALRG